MKKILNSGFLFAVIFLSACSKKATDDPPSANKNFFGFQFNIDQNATLAQDIDCDIQTDTIYATTFSGTDLAALKPSFSFEGK